MTNHPEMTQGDLRTANDRFKDSFRQWFWGSMITATLAHFMVFAFFPQLTAADVSTDGDAFELLDIPPELDVPEPPEPLARPATPIVTDALIDDDITIAPTTMEAWEAARIVAPPDREDADLSDQPVFTPWTVLPVLTNDREVEQALAREYPGSLRGAGIGGAVNVWLFVDTLGVVQNQKVQTSSGYESLDEAALNVAKVARFTPAQNLDQKVPVWVAQVITFRVR